MMNNKKKILTIDGGGIKGVIPASFLASIEETLGKRVADHFDLIAGTSTGGIIALCLGLGLSGKEILEFYSLYGPKIFDSERSPLKRWFKKGINHARRIFSSKYSPEELASALHSVFKDKRLGESNVRLIIPSFDSNRRTVHVFKTAHHSRFECDWKEKAQNVALATASAPTYFPTHKLDNGATLLDGGVWANNPIGMAVVEAIGVLGWPREDLYVLSLGCSEDVFEIKDNSGFLGMATKAVDIFLIGQSCGSIGTAKLLTNDSNDNKRIYRYSQAVPRGMFKLDSAGSIDSLKGIGFGLARDALPEIRQIFFDSRSEPFIPFYR